MNSKKHYKLIYIDPRTKKETAASFWGKELMDRFISVMNVIVVKIVLL